MDFFLEPIVSQTYPQTLQLHAHLYSHSFHVIAHGFLHLSHTVPLCLHFSLNSMHVTAHEVFTLFCRREIFFHVLCMLCCSSRKFGTTRILFSSISLGALSSLLRTLLVLVLPQAAPMQGECLGTNQTDIMARPASPTTWPGLTLHTYRLFIHVQTWQSQIPSLDKELQCVLTYHMDS